MNCTKLQELAAARALGALDPAETARLEALLADDPDAREELGAFLDTAVALASALPARQPSAALRDRILEQIARSSKPQPSTDAAPAPALPAGFRWVPDDGQGWTAAGLPGARVKLLSISTDMGYQVRMVELAPGGRVPEHDHPSSEEVLVLSGHLHTEGRILGPRDYLHADPGTHHGELISPDGCVAIIINRAPTPA